MAKSLTFICLIAALFSAIYTLCFRSSYSCRASVFFYRATAAGYSYVCLTRLLDGLLN